MKKTVKGFILGTIITTMLMSTALGAGVKKTIEVAFNSINLTVNGDRVDADTILYEGTTYIPLRAAAEMLGKDVGWDQNTSTASIDDKKEPVIKEEPKPEKKPVIKEEPKTDNESDQKTIQQLKEQSDGSYKFELVTPTESEKSKDNTKEKPIRQLKKNEDGTWDYEYVYP